MSYDLIPDIILYEIFLKVKGIINSPKTYFVLKWVVVAQCFSLGAPTSNYSYPPPNYKTS